MKKREFLKVSSILTAILVITTGVFSQSEKSDWENPLLYEVNKEAPRASFMLFSTQGDVIRDDYSLSPFHQSLNGAWKFVYVAI